MSGEITRTIQAELDANSNEKYLGWLKKFIDSKMGVNKGVSGFQRVEIHNGDEKTLIENLIDWSPICLLAFERDEVSPNANRHRSHMANETFLIDIICALEGEYDINRTVVFELKERLNYHILEKRNSAYNAGPISYLNSELLIVSKDYGAWLRCIYAVPRRKTYS